MPDLLHPSTVLYPFARLASRSSFVICKIKMCEPTFQIMVSTTGEHLHTLALTGGSRLMADFRPSRVSLHTL